MPVTRKVAMPTDVLLPALVGVLPVLSFLAALLYLDGYKLVKLRAVIAVVVCGVVVAVASYLVNGQALELLAMDFANFARYIGPVIEELLKGLVIVVLIRTHRIGFLVDAAIFGFAVGTGFAMVENLYYLDLVPDAGMGTWIVRGFGTALMHGGATAIFAVMGLALLERGRRPSLQAFVPGFAVAVVLHSAYNHLLSRPKIATLAILVVLPPAALCRLPSGANEPWATGSAKDSMPTRKCWSSSTRAAFPIRRSESISTR